MSREEATEAWITDAKYTHGWNDTRNHNAC